MSHIKASELPRCLLQWLEDGLGERFADVDLHVRGARAYAAPGRVVVPESVMGRAATPASRLVLAHEFAHVAQFRRATSAAAHAPAGELEAEAAQAAVALAGGRTHRCRMAAAPGAQLAWGVAGHYYTVYFVLLAAGLEPVMAKTLAFYAQMPDQVDELDATSAGVDMMVSVRDAPVLRDIQIQMGLHALTGGDAEQETAGRATRLKSAPLGSFEFGLALHAYGDSYAHRQISHPARMYDPGFGHAVEYIHFRDAHSPDFTNRRSLLFKRYGTELFDLVRTMPGVGSARMNTSTVGSAMDSITAVDGDSAQIATVRAMTLYALQQKMDPYRPEAEKLQPWESFRGAHPGLKGTLLAEAQGFAARWVIPPST
jgi:hypothetical protein